jgi:hypothetical protein
MYKNKRLRPAPIRLNRKWNTTPNIGMSLYENTVKSSEPIEEDEQDIQFKLRYEKESVLHIEEIDFIITNLIDRSDFKIEKDYNSFNLRREDSKGNIYLRIGKEQITVECNDINTHSNFQLQDKTLYQKWYSKLEDKYFEFNNKNTKNTLNMLCTITNLKRKTKIAKLIEEDNNKK